MARCLVRLVLDWSVPGSYLVAELPVVATLSSSFAAPWSLVARYNLQSRLLETTVTYMSLPSQMGSGLRLVGDSFVVFSFSFVRLGV